MDPTMKLMMREHHRAMKSLVPIPKDHDADPHDELANAIILQAVKDYRKALQVLERRSDSMRWIKVKLDCESFFRSEWFQLLTNTDPDLILDRLKKEAAV